MKRYPAFFACGLIVTTLLILPNPVAYAGPPSHAPAHGWRKKHDPYYFGYSGRQWERDYGIINGRCNREAIGTVLGGAVGGAIGSTVGKEEHRTVAIILGTVLGAVIGNRIGKAMDDTDRACIGHSLELAEDRKTVSWSNPDSGLNYQLTPIRGFEANGLKCREYTLAVRGKNVNETRNEQACNAGEGKWEPYSKK